MSGIDTLGGLGRGLMIGTDFMNKRRAMDEQKEYRDQVVQNSTDIIKMNKEKHGIAMDQYGLQKAEQDRIKLNEDVYGNIQNQYSDRTDYERAGLFVDTGLKAGLFKPHEIEAAKKNHEGLLKLAGVDAYEALLRGDTTQMNRVFKSGNFGEIEISEDGKMYNITPADGSKKYSVDKNGLLQNHYLSLAADRQARNAANALAGHKATAEINKTYSEIGKNNAETLGKTVDATRDFQYITGPDGNPVPNPYYAPKEKHDPIKDLQGYIDATKTLFPETLEDREDALSRGYELYKNIIENNPGMSQGQAATIVKDTIQLGMRRGDVEPEIGKNGNLILTGKVDGRTYIVNPNLSENQALGLKGADDKLLYPKGIGEVYLRASKNLEAGDPKGFKNASILANDDEAFFDTAKNLQNAKPGDPRLLILKQAEIIRRGREYEKTLPTEKPKGLGLPTKTNPSFANIIPGGLGLSLDRTIKKTAGIEDPEDPVATVKTWANGKGLPIDKAMLNHVLDLIDKDPTIAAKFNENEIWAMHSEVGDRENSRRAYGKVR